MMRAFFCAAALLALASSCLGDDGCYEECKATTKDRAALIDCYKAACGGHAFPDD